MTTWVNQNAIDHVWDMFSKEGSDTVDVSLWQGIATDIRVNKDKDNSLPYEYVWRANYPSTDLNYFNFERKDCEIWQDYIGRYFSTYKDKEEHKMYVYDCIIVDKESDEIVFDGRLIASTSEQAKMMALADIMRESAPTNEVIANYHFVVVKVGEGYSK